MCPLVPAKAGTQGSRRKTRSERPLDSRLRGNERMRLWINSTEIRSSMTAVFSASGNSIHSRHDRLQPGYLSDFVGKFAFGAPRYQVLYRCWLTKGEAAFNVVSSRALADAIAGGAGRLECAALPFSYRHLSPLVGETHPASKGAEEGDEGRARPQPSAGWLDRIATICNEKSASTDDSTSEGVVP